MNPPHSLRRNSSFTIHTHVNPRKGSITLKNNDVMASTSVHDDDYLDTNRNRKSESESLLANGETLSSDLDPPSPSRDPNQLLFHTDAKHRLVFNVGGEKFQTLQRNLKKVKSDDFKLANPRFLEGYYDEEEKEYFFDHDPEVFRCVLNYWRTGQLHLPLTRCGPHIKEELAFWGLKEIDIERCCWNSYNSWMQSMSSLEIMEMDRDLYVQQSADEMRRKGASKCDRCMAALWSLLTEPTESLAARIYAYIALVFVVFAIFSFCASTHKVFQITTESDVSQTNSSSTLPPSVNQTVDNSTDGQIVKEETKKKLKVEVHPALFYIDMVCLVFFTVEYLLRFICAPKRCRFLISFTAVLDLLAILPDYIELLVYYVHPDMQDSHGIISFMPFLRLMRVFRIFRLIRRVPGLWIMIYTLKASFKELSLMLVFLLVGTLLFSSIIFFVDDQKVFDSIPQSFWWAIVTMTTVGYGDMTPKTALGQLVGSVTAVCGVLIIGFTIPSLVNNFITYYGHVEFVMRKEQLEEEEKKLQEEKKRLAWGKEKLEGEDVEDKDKPLPMVDMNPGTSQSVSSLAANSTV